MNFGNILRQIIDSFFAVITFVKKPLHSSIILTYIFFFFFGIFGGHHFYLKRNRHAFVLFTTFGCLGFCLLYDFFNIPGYVRLANSLRFPNPNRQAFSDPEERPSFNFTRFICQVAFGGYLGTLCLAMFPMEIVETYYFLVLLLHAIAVTFGVYTIANIGQFRCSFNSCLLGSVLLIPYGLCALDAQNIGSVISLTALASSLSALFTGWRFAQPEDIKDRNCLVRFALVYVLGFLVLIGTFSAIYFNAKVTTTGGLVMPLSDFIAREMPMQDVKDTWKQLMETLREKGWVNFVLHFLEMISMEGFDHEAFKVLELQTNATEEQVHSQYRKLAGKYHPDKYIRSNAWNKLWAAKQFMLVRQAYEHVLPYVKKHGKSSANVKEEL